ncbi:MAG: hypothetical protein PWP48_1234 [Clostridiales bacterium]|nr:hypothetical protein [Clostridiales bacterium]
MKRSSVLYKICALALSGLLLILAMNILPTAVGYENAAKASSLTYSAHTMQSDTIETINMVHGVLSSGNNNSLVTKNQQYLIINSTSNGTSQEVSFWSEISLASSGACIMGLEIDITSKMSVTGCTQKIYLYNYDTSAYEELKSTAIGTTDTDAVYLNENNPTIDKYVSSENRLRIKITVTNSSYFNAYFDYVNIIYNYQPQDSNRSVSTYNIDNATLEYGTLSANNPTYLRQRDQQYYSVNSGNNKVAWSSKVTLDQPRGNIKTLVITYSGKYSTSANNSWLSVWNYETGNWEAIYNFVSDTNTRTVCWTTSDPIYINRFVSEFNDVRIRLYNSASGAFTRNSDYLNITVYYNTPNSIKFFSPDTITAEYGSISDGDVTNLSDYDNSPLVMNSSSDNKIAWQAETTINVDRQYIKSLTVFTRVKYSGNANTQYFSLWNNRTNSWNVFRQQTVSTSNENLIMTITDPDIIYDVISSSGVIKTRLYNSASTAFNRSTDVLTFSVEYGTVGTFEFAHISDIHELIGSDNFKAIINEINTSVNPAFTVITGDITDHGTPAQYDKYLEDLVLLNGTVYTGIGNHDVRWWNSNGKNDFKDKIGPLYYSFNYGGVHFIMLDSAVNFELDEKFGKAQLSWLVNDLSGISADMPVIIFAHHPFKMYDNVTGKKELIDVVKNYNVVAFMAGHQHYWGYTVENGILWEYITYVKDNPAQEYASIKVTPNKLYIYKRKASDGSKTLWLTAPITNKRKASMTITNVAAQPDGDVNVSVQISKAPDGVSTVQARIDNYGPWTTLTQNGDVWSGTISISNYSPSIPYGKHFIGVNMTDNTGNVWKEYKEYEWAGGNVTTKWVFQTGDVIQSTPTYFNGTVYVGSEDGSVYAINDSDGTLEWSYTTGDQIISKPAIYDGVTKDLVIIGSHDKKLYALDADSGALEWSYATGGSVISDPLVDNGVVYFGSGDKYIYALDASNGNFKWKYQTDGLMRQRPIVYDGKLYAFVRDTYIWYALNISDGSLYWRGNAATDESMFVCGDVRPIMTAGNKLWTIDAQNTKAGYLDPTDGNLDWTSTVTNISSRGPATDGTRIFYPSNNGRQIYAFNVSDNTQVWYKDLRAGGSDSDLQEFQIDSALIYSEGILYHVAERGRITGLDPVTGNIKFVYDAVGYPERSLWSTPEVYNKTVYVGGLDGKVYAIKYNGT